MRFQTNISREVYRNLDHKMLRAWRAKALNLTLEMRPPRPRGPKIDLKGKVGTLTEQLREYIDKAQQLSEREGVTKTIEHYVEEVEKLDEAR